MKATLPAKTSETVRYIDRWEALLKDNTLNIESIKINTAIAHKDLGSLDARKARQIFDILSRKNVQHLEWVNRATAVKYFMSLSILQNVYIIPYSPLLNTALNCTTYFDVQCVSFILQDFERLLQPDKKW